MDKRFEDGKKWVEKGHDCINRKLEDQMVIWELNCSNG